MNDALTRTSLLVLAFFVGWFMWDQYKLIEDQRKKIQQLEIQSFYDMIIIQQLQTQQYDRNNKNNDNPI
jgi:hypothetical protein